MWIEDFLITAQWAMGPIVAIMGYVLFVAMAIFVIEEWDKP